MLDELLYSLPLMMVESMPTEKLTSLWLMLNFMPTQQSKPGMVSKDIALQPQPYHSPYSIGGHLLQVCCKLYTAQKSAFMGVIRFNPGKPPPPKPPPCFCSTAGKTKQNTHGHA